MGSCLGNNSTATLKADEEESKVDGEDGDVYRTQGYKLLLLGTGESGKSTLFKRMLFEFGDGYNEEERVDFAESIFENTIDSMKVLIKQTTVLEEKYDTAMSPDVDAAATHILNLESNVVVSPETADAIKKLWADEGIQTAFKYRSQFQLPDSAKYFFENVANLTQIPYIPSKNDVLRCRDRTTGIHTQSVKIPDGKNKERVFEIIDVGGQRAERKKWVNVFKNVQMVLFVVALSEFDQICFEDSQTNRLKDAIDMFQKITNSPFFKNTPILLLFNKIDILQEKLSYSHVKFEFEGYGGEQTVDEIGKFITHTFKKRDETAKLIKSQLVCAIDEDLDLPEMFQKIVAMTKNAKSRTHSKKVY